VCTEYVKFSFVCPCPNAHINCMCLRCEIKHVCEMTDRLCHGIASYIRQSSVSYSLSPLLNPTHDFRKQKSQSSLCMPTYTDKDKEIDFPAVRYVDSHMQTLVHLPIHSAFAFTGHLKVTNNCRFCFRLRYRYVLHTVLFTLTL